MLAVLGLLLAGCTGLPRYALVAGPSRDYLWILAREKRLPEAVMTDLRGVAQANGFDASALIQRESARRLSRLRGSEPGLRPIPRRRSGLA